MRIAAVGSALPEHFYDQAALLAAFREQWAERYFNLRRLEELHRNVLVGGRHLALPIEEYPKIESWGEANDYWIRVAQELGGEAVLTALDRAGVNVDEVDAFYFTTVTGVATRSIDARLMNRLRRRGILSRSSHRVSTTGGEWQPSVVLFANRAPQRSATTPASPNSRKSQHLATLRRPRHETR